MNTRTSLKIIVIAIPILLILLGVISSKTTGFSEIAPINYENSSPIQTGNSPTQNTLVLTDNQTRYPLGLHLDILEDPSGLLTIGDVISSTFASKFTPSQVAVPNYGYTSSAYWVRLRLDNETRATDEWLLEVGFPNIQYVDLYSPLSNGQGFDLKQTGALRPISTRDVVYPNIVISLSIPTHTQQTYYLRFMSGSSMTIPLTLWAKNAFIAASGQSVILQWIIFGGFIALLIYHLFLLLILRERTYAYFVIMLASMLAVMLVYTGYFEIYVFPSLYNLKTIYYPLFVTLMYASIILFSDSFLELRTRHPRLHQANIAMLVVWGVLALLVPFVSYLNISRLMTPWQLVTIGATWVIGILARRKGVRWIGFFMVAWLGMAMSLFLLLLVRLAIIPSTAFDENVFQLGFLVMAVSWSIALADRINMLKQEAENANRDLRGSEHKLTQILEGMPLGVIVYGKDQKPNYMNERTAEIVGNPELKLKPNPADESTFAQGVDQFSFQKAGSDQTYPVENMPVYKALQGKPSYVDDFEMNQRDKRIPLEIWASPIKDEAGNVNAAVVVFQDITQRKQADAELADYRKNLEQLVKTRTAELNELNKQLQLRIEWLSTVNQIQQTLTGIADLPQAYKKLSDTVCKLMDAGVVFIMRWDDKDDQLQMLCLSPSTDSFPTFEEIKPIFIRGTMIRNELDAGKVFLSSIEKPASLPDPLGGYFKENAFQSVVLSPIMTHQESSGVLGIASAASMQDDIMPRMDLIERMSFDLGGIAEDAMLLEHKHTLSTLEERNRLARDLHDSVTQALFTATLLTDVMPQVWHRDPEEGLQMLEKLGRLTRGALAEMRTMLVELRPSSVLNTPLSELLAQLTEAITSRSGLPFELYIEKIPILPDDVQMNFYRIAQEALNNVMKHAQAMHVNVSLSEVQLSPDVNGIPGRQIKLVIQDDGVGFSPGIEKVGHLGIGIMRERSAAIQAALTLESQPGHGTLLSVVWSSEM